MAAFAALGLAAVVGWACGAPRLPAPDFTGHPTEALAQVPYPPPPARVEMVPKRPNDTAVWIDGEWTWQTRRWSWKPGRWVLPPANARFAPWTSVRDELGTLYVANGVWRDAKGVEIDEPAPLLRSKPSPAPVVNEDGENVVQGPIDNSAFDGGRTRKPADDVRAGEALDASTDLSSDGGVTDRATGARLEAGAL